MSGPHKASDTEIDESDFSALAAAMAAMTVGAGIGALAAECSAFARRLREAHPLKCAASFGGLLTVKQLQANCLRIEALVHICITSCSGTRAPSPQLLTQGFTAVGAACGHLEDPAEDIFVGSIGSRRGNYRVLEGIWECGTFYLQRLVNLADTLPIESGLHRLADSVHALLRLSDIVCERSKLQRNELGSELGLKALPSKLSAQCNELRRRVEFRVSELPTLGIDINDLQPFVFDPDGVSQLLTQTIGNTALEARPLALDGDQLFLVLPTAVSVAIRHLLISALAFGANSKVFRAQLANEYSRTFGATPLLGGSRGGVPFSHTEAASIACMSDEVDKGRHLVLVFFMDTLEGFYEGGFAGAFRGSEGLEQALARTLDSVTKNISEGASFEDGVVLIVGCGVGRGAAMKLPRPSVDKWRFDFVSAPDLCTLSFAKDATPLNLWRIPRMQDQLSRMGVTLHNMNGLLNLHAWAFSMNGHLVPHASIPEDVTDQRSLRLLITQNANCALRHEVSESTDRHVEQFIDQSWLEVIRSRASAFKEDVEQPVYVHLRRTGGPLGLFISANRCWWFEACEPESNAVTWSSNRWEMMRTWLRRAIPQLEKTFSQALGGAPVIWRCSFDYTEGVTDALSTGTEDDAIQSIRADVCSNPREIAFKISEGFGRALFHPENIAERALVSALVAAVAELSGSTRFDLNSLVSQIVPNAQARQSHCFRAQNVRDFMPGLADEEPVTISEFDDASEKLGLGWRARRIEDGGRIEGKEQCLAFLNPLVTQLENDLCSELQHFSRSDFLIALLTNYEVAAVSRERWKRTSAAILALREDKKAVYEVITDNTLRLNAVFQMTRNLIEMAVCECPTVGGRQAGRLDIGSLLTKASVLFHLAGLSDLIFWETQQPLLVIRPLGDVHADHDYVDSVMTGFVGMTSKATVDSAASKYARSLEDPQELGSEAAIDKEGFLDCWEKEIGVDLHSFRLFIDALEDHAIKAQNPVLQLRRSELIAFAHTPEIGKRIVETLSLKTRRAWREVPEGYFYKDIAPSRFRRRLSSLRRPLLVVSDEDDPKIVVAPGLLREGFASTVANYAEASFPSWQLGTDMKAYAGRIRAASGLKFNTLVADRMSALGWMVEREIKLTEICGKRFELNYGDVDVFAFDRKSGRVLVMECKDLQYLKTPGEIAEQLFDFRREINRDGKRDLLLKHLDRVQTLQREISAVSKFTGIQNVKIESHLVFKNPVPMQFARGPIREKVRLHTFDHLDRLTAPR